jgi:hypothetical protein
MVRTQRYGAAGNPRTLTPFIDRVIFVAIAFAVLPIGACGGDKAGSGFSGGSGSSAKGGLASSPGANSFNAQGSSPNGNSTSSGGDAGVPCPAGLQCNVGCTGGASTTVSGTVYDPAGNDPLYNVTVYVPASPLQPLPSGVPTGSAACSCSALYPSGALTSTTTAVDGTFTLTNVPVGSAVPLVAQIGKWRRSFSIQVTACQNNAQPDKSLVLPGTIVDANDSMPEIAVSTGASDSLECLMERIGLPASEYVAGTATGGHVHIFSGGNPMAGGRGMGGMAGMGGMGGMGGAGRPETPPMPGAPASATSLWSTQDQLMPYDIVLLSCEGGETYDANPQALEAYLNAGGRAFASHYHYSWFSGPLNSGQAYTAPADWGNNLAAWTANGGQANGPVAGVIDTTLNGSTQPFPKGQALAQWLALVGALGTDGVPAADLAIYQPRDNAQVAATNTASQPWITASPWTLYFSFDTPVTAAATSEGGAPAYCGRAVFSDLHVAGNPLTTDTAPPPGGCADTALSPQEKALEFMLFDLSSCVIPDNVPPPTTGIIPR